MVTSERQEYLRQIGDVFSSELLLEDVRRLEEHGVNEDIMAVLGTEHFLRTVALLKCCDDVFARNLLTMLSKQLLSQAQDCQARIEVAG